MAKQNIIIDGDWGGDELTLAAVLAAHAAQFEILGTTCVFGNTSHAQVLNNAGALLKLLKLDGTVSRYPGAQAPNGTPLLAGDNAHGADGVGGVLLLQSSYSHIPTPAHQFILNTLMQQPESSVIITATGPLTNIARATAENKAVMQRVKALHIMGGCTNAIPAHDMPVRQGNITPYAEFNFQQAATDADNVMQSGLPISLYPMNCTHQLTLTPERAAKIRAAFHADTALADQLIAIMSAPAALDASKFNSAPIMHDVHTALGILAPEFYTGSRGHVGVTKAGDRMGMSTFTPDPAGPVQVMTQIDNPDRLFDDFILPSVVKVLLTHNPSAKD